ncbi:MAG: hypothetical protein LBM75_06065 [Myxococcales bacterium]|jgi:hypothetical protein|nr:hypothetical protein [Myxococcales bacterium]
MPPLKPQETPNYRRELFDHPLHKTALAILAVLVLVCLWRRLWPIALILAMAEVLFLLIVPRLPGFRRTCDARQASDVASKRAAMLDQIASRLSMNAKARYDGLLRSRAKLLDVLRAQPSPDVLEALWTPRLTRLCDWALRLLVSIDATRADAHDQRALESEAEQLVRDIDALEQGSATRTLKAQKLEMTRGRLDRFSKIKDQRDAAIVQVEIIEGLLDELLAKGLASHDESAFCAQLELLRGQVDALGDSLGHMAQEQSAAQALDALKSLNL